MSTILDFLTNLTKTEIVIVAFALLFGALLLPLSTGARQTLVLVLIALGVFTLIGGGMGYVTALFQ